MQSSSRVEVVGGVGEGVVAGERERRWAEREERVLAKLGLRRWQ